MLKQVSNAVYKCDILIIELCDLHILQYFIYMRNSHRDAVLMEL